MPFKAGNLSYLTTVAVILSIMFKNLLYICKTESVGSSGRILDSKLRDSRFESCRYNHFFYFLNDKHLS
jgi:hypothetical protein